jgi:hypothetical protein
VRTFLSLSLPLLRVLTAILETTTLYSRLPQVSKVIYGGSTLLPFLPSNIQTQPTSPKRRTRHIRHIILHPPPILQPPQQTNPPQNAPHTTSLTKHKRKTKHPNHRYFFIKLIRSTFFLASSIEFISETIGAPGDGRRR